MADLNKVLIIGGEGTIGKELNFGIKTARNEVDITEEDSIRKAIKKYSPSAILNLVSVNLRISEQDPLLATKINVQGMMNACTVAKEHNLPLILISSGTVFNGSKEEIFDEDASPSPKNTYGLTKFLAEKIVINYKKGIVIRTGWLFGFTQKMNFFNSIYDKAKKNEELSVTYDQYGSFTRVSDFIVELKQVIKNDEFGIKHVVNEDSASAFDFTKELVFLLKSKSNIIKKSISEEEKTGLKRSKSEVLTSKKIKMRGWKIALKELIL